MFWSFNKGTIEVTSLNDLYLDNLYSIRKGLGEKVTYRMGDKPNKRIFVLDFKGDMLASQAAALAEEVSAILSVAHPQKDEVLVKVESLGGAAHSYGYAASQLQRIKTKGIPLTVAVDKVAASGGYMMACVADNLIAAPFAIVGSVGVLALVPNVSKILKKVGIDYKEYTAGKYKKTISTFTEPTEEGEKKFQQDMERLHNLFINHVSSHREVDPDMISTGETWFGTEAKENGLVDELKTSEEYIMDNILNKEVVEIKYVGKPSVAKRMGFAAANLISSIILRVYGFIRNEFNWIV